MKIPLQVSFRNMPPSDVIEANIREKAAKLDSFYDRIMACRVIVEAPHRRHHKGKLYHVRIDLTLPGGELVVKREPKHVEPAKLRSPQLSGRELTESHEPSKYAAHDDVYIAIRDAFNAAGRKLQDYARRQRGTIKAHEPAALARVTKLFREDGFGFLETADGRELYFHKNSVLEPGFDHIELGTQVHYAEEEGEQGPQASTVRLAGKHAMAQ
jgi:cold shock CspA family protein